MNKIDEAINSIRSLECPTDNWKTRLPEYSRNTESPAEPKLILTGL